MKVVTTFHASSSVLSSLKCCLAARDVEHLVVVKLNRLVVYSIRPEGLHHECTTEIWGKVMSVKAVPIAGSARSNLVLLIAHPDPELVFFSYTESEDGDAELKPRKQLSLYERTPRPAEFFNDILVHPSGKIAVVSCYTGKLKVITFHAGNYKDDFDVLLPELNVLSLAFLHTPEEEYSLAILHIDHQERIQLLARDLSVDDTELSSYHSTVLHPTVISHNTIPFATENVPMLIPVSPPTSDDGGELDEDSFMGGILVVGGRKIILFELAPREAQEKQKGKRRRLESRKKSTDAAEVSKAKGKEKERENRKRKPKASVEWPWNRVAAWCGVDEQELKFFIGDSYGKLSMLSLENLADLGLILIPLGEASPPTTLTYLTNQALYLGSHMGDSQLLQISPTPVSLLDSPTLPIPRDVKTTPLSSLAAPGTVRKGKGRVTNDDAMDVDSSPAPSKGCVIETKGSFINVLETYKNIAPIMDGILVDIDGSGQRQIITCSGGRNTGSVNVVRNGADFQELAFASGIIDVTGVWAARPVFSDEANTHVVVSTLNSTTLFRIDGTGSNTTFKHIDGSHFEEGIITNQPTLAFANIREKVASNPGAGDANYSLASRLIVQVTPLGAVLLEYDPVMDVFVRHSGWWAAKVNSGPGRRKDPEVVAASINASQILLALSGGLLVVIHTEGTKFSPSENNVNVYRTSHEISAVSCSPLDPTKAFSPYFSVAYWETNVVEVLKPNATGFTSVCKSSPLPAVVRSLLLFNFGSEQSGDRPDFHPHLLAGLGDGSLVSFAFKSDSEKRRELKDQKRTHLGHAPVILSFCNIEGRVGVFAAGNRATIISWEKKRLLYSPIMLKEITGAAPLTTSTFQNSLILATPTGLSIGSVKDVDKMHIRSVPFGLDNPRRIAYEPDLKILGVACTRTEPARVGDNESCRSCFKILDDTTLAPFSEFKCAADEEITAVVSFSGQVNGVTKPLFCLGTYVCKDDEKEPTSGRLLIFTAFPNMSNRDAGVELSLIASADVKGCVCALTIVEDKILAAVNSSVAMYYLHASESSDDSLPASMSLRLATEWNHNYFVTSLGSYGNNVVVGDQISSISLLRVDGSSICSVARDYGPLWPVSVEAIDADHIIGANDSLNLFTFSLTRSMGRSALERDGGYHVADLVTKFVRGSLSSDVSTSGLFAPEQVFFTSSGRIGVIVNVVDSGLSLHLTALQRNLAGVLEGVGGGAHPRFRAPKSVRGRSDAESAAFGFLDGDFLEQFLSLIASPAQLDKVISGRSTPEQLKLPVEELQKVLENLQSLH